MKKERTYNDNIHFLGRTTMTISTIAILLIPVVICLVLNVWPDASTLIAGLVGVWVLFIPINIIEFLTFGTMLGSAGSYLGFITGNLSNLKVPCALNALSNADIKSGTEEGDIITTLSVAASSIITTIIIIIAIIPLGIMGTSAYPEALAPAFDNMLPALFGGLALVLIGKNYKLAIAPIALAVVAYTITTVLNLTVLEKPFDIPVSVLIPITALVSIGCARIMYKKGKIDLNNYK